MKTLLILLTLLSILQAEKTVTIGTHTFTLIEEDYSEYGDKGVTMMLYAKDANRSKLPQFRFVLRYQSGSCDVKNVEDGVYRIEKERIVTHSHWTRYSNDNAPIGDRMQVFKVDENGSFYVSESKVYIEKTTRNEGADEGMKYLYEDANTVDEKALLAAYIASVERLFDAKFVSGDAAKALGSEVFNALQVKYKTQWN
jgi:hypothetical protein